MPPAGSPTLMTSSPKVTGLDLSLNGTGICYPDGSYLTVRRTARNGDRRLTDVRNHVAEAAGLNSRPVDLVVIEDLPKHAKGSGLTALVHGVTRQLLSENGVPYVRVVPSTLKKYATGNGAADKKLMAKAALERAGLHFDVTTTVAAKKQDNECDAWWAYVMGLDYMGYPLFPLPARNRDSLKHIIVGDIAPLLKRLRAA